MEAENSRNDTNNNTNNNSGTKCIHQIQYN